MNVEGDSVTIAQGMAGQFIAEFWQQLDHPLNRLIGQPLCIGANSAFEKGDERLTKLPIYRRSAVWIRIQPFVEAIPVSHSLRWVWGLVTKTGRNLDIIANHCDKSC